MINLGDLVRKVGGTADRNLLGVVNKIYVNSLGVEMCYVTTAKGNRVWLAHLLEVSQYFSDKGTQ